MEYTNKMKTARRGVVLIWALITMAVTTTILGAIGAHYANAMRIGQSYLHVNEDYYAFLNFSERFIEDVDKAVANIGKGDTAVSLGSNFSPEKLKKVLQDLDGKVCNTDDGNYRVVFNITDLSNVDRLATQQQTVITLKATVFRQEKPGGDFIKVKTFEQKIEFVKSSDGSLTSSAIFDYVYFANNYGHLVSPNNAKIIANGDVGANDKFTINGATINGYVKVPAQSADALDSAVFLEGTSYIWPYATYLSRVVKQYYDSKSPTDFCTLVRPTNPYLHNGEQWKFPFGYEGPDSLSEALSISPEGTTTLSYPDEGKNPYSSDGYRELTSNPKSDPGPKPTGSTMPKPKDPGKGYYSTGRKLVYNKGGGKSQGWDKGIWKDVITAFDLSTYKSDLKGWLGANNYNVGKNWDKNFPSSSSSTYWEKVGYSQKTEKSQYEVKSFKLDSYETAVINWAKGKGISTTVEPSAAQLSVWEGQRNAYISYTNSLAGYKKEYEKWQAAKAAWLAAQSNPDGSTVLTLTKETYHLDTLKDPNKMMSIIQALTDLVVMPNVSDDETYKEYCRNCNVSNAFETSTNSSLVTIKGGCLKCANRYTTEDGDRNITFSFVTTNAEVYVRNESQWYEYNDNNAWGTWKEDMVYGKGYAFGTNVLATSDAQTRTLAYVNVANGGSGATVYPFASRTNNKLANDGEASDPYYKKGLMTEAGAAALRTAEAGSVILIGTANYPIEIRGPVYFDGDVVIRGFVSGQGTIYAGRNIYIIGDITYLNPPSWPHTTDEMNAKTPDEVKAENATKDLLMLVARGNIIVGDYTSSEWMSSCRTWMTKGKSDKSYVSSNQYCKDYKDDEIGYAGFDNDYTDFESEGASDDNARVVFGAFAQSPYKTSPWNYQRDGMIAGENHEGQTWIVTTKEVRRESGRDKVVTVRKRYRCDINYYAQVPTVTTGARRFYQCKLGDEVISGLMQTGTRSATSTTQTTVVQQPSWRWSSWAIWQWLFHRKRFSSWFSRYGSYYAIFDNDNHGSSSEDVSDAADMVSDDGNAGDVTRIDAVLFANHGIFGRVGGTASHKFQLHGSLLCRDEGLLPSFVDRFQKQTDAEAWINWDMRLKSGSPGTVSTLGQPMTTKSTVRLEMRPTSWRQTDFCP